MSNWTYRLVRRLGIWTKRALMMGPLDPVLSAIAEFMEGRGTGSSQSPGEVLVDFADNLKMFMPANTPSLARIAHHLYETELTNALPGLIGSGMGIVDIGANVGYYTLLSSRLVGPTGRVFAFEPAPDVYPYLQRNLALNECFNVVTRSLAVTDTVGD